MAGREIKIGAHDGRRFTAYLAAPERTPSPGLLVLPEIYNANEHIRGVADGFAAAGFLALAPDVFWRIEREQWLPYTPEGQAKARALNERLDVDQLIEDLGAAIDHLRGLPDCSGPVGAIGFCLGGKLAYLCAARHDIQAAVSYYGVKIDQYLDEASAISCPLLLHFAGNDAHVPPEAVARIGARLAGHDQVQIHLYENVEHGFNRKGYPPYDQSAAALARSRTLALLHDALDD